MGNHLEQVVGGPQIVDRDLVGLNCGVDLGVPRDERHRSLGWALLVARDQHAHRHDLETRLNSVEDLAWQEVCLSGFERMGQARTPLLWRFRTRDVSVKQGWRRGGSGIAKCEEFAGGISDPEHEVGHRKIGD